MNCADFVDNGLTFAEALTAATLFAGGGFDAIEVSGGTIAGGKLSPSRTGIATIDKTVTDARPQADRTIYVLNLVLPAAECIVLPGKKRRCRTEAPDNRAVPVPPLTNKR
jgi:hypothetical protein